MDLPPRPDLPFFAYGLFRPGQLGFLRLKDFVQQTEPAKISGHLRIRDGLPIAEEQGPGEIEGTLLNFPAGQGEAAYRRIIDLEPSHQYRWGEIRIGQSEANLLWGKSPRRGSQPLDEDWDGQRDPLFTDALDVIATITVTHKDPHWNNHPLFYLQAAYLLLWTAIERYLSLRYHLGEDVMPKISMLATEPAFREALQRHVTGMREIFSAADPKNKVTLNPREPQDAVNYYYQIRSNLIHRGKAMTRDHERIHECLTELLPIFRHVLERAFHDASHA